MPKYIDDYPWLDVPDFTELTSQLYSGKYNDDICVRYTSRSNMELNVYPDGRIIVKCPADSGLSDIEEYINENEAWIRKTLGGYIDDNRRMIRKITKKHKPEGMVKCYHWN